MRESKFRGYSPYLEKMSKTFSLKEIGSRDWAWFSNEESDGAVDPGDVIEMQWTGLRDRSGKEIYDGDILLWHGASTDPSSQMYSRPIEVKFVVEEVTEEGFATGIHLPNPSTCYDIIGNIYEKQTEGK